MDNTVIFDEQRALLFSIAYRMLGSVMDAEDCVQEAYLRWQQADAAQVRDPRAYLSTVVTRLCLDQLRSARARREVYVGPWLPEPLVGALPAADTVEQVESLSMAFLLILERLSPEERAVFLLRQVFDYSYAEVAQIVGKSEAACRQLLHRARESLAANRPRFEPSPQRREELARSFFAAWAEGELDGLVSLLEEDIVLRSDGGGKATAARQPIHGAQKVARFLLGITAKAPPGAVVLPALVNGQPGVVVYVDGQPITIFALHVGEHGISAIDAVVNPDKLRHVPPLAG